MESCQFLFLLKVWRSVSAGDYDEFSPPLKVKNEEVCTSTGPLQRLWAGARLIMKRLAAAQNRKTELSVILTAGDTVHNIYHPFDDIQHPQVKKSALKYLLFQYT